MTGTGGALLASTWRSVVSLSPLVLVTLSVTVYCPGPGGVQS